MSNISKTVIVTGASGDIGLATVQTLLEQGYRVAACFYSNETILLENFSQQKNLEIYKVDLSDDDDIKNCVRLICAEASEISALVNCAGVASGELFGMTKIADMRSLFQVNFFGILLFTQYVVKKMIRKKRGRLLILVLQQASLQMLARYLMARRRQRYFMPAGLWQLNWGQWGSG